MAAASGAEVKPSQQETARVVREARLVRLLSIAALLLLATGLGLQWIKRTNTDLPPVATMDQAFADAAAATDGVVWDTRHHDAGARAWSGAWIVRNRQYDARVLSTAALLWQCLAVVILLVALARRLPAGAFLAWSVIVALMVIARGAAGVRPLDDTVWSSILVSLSALQVVLMTGARLTAWRVGAGLACGVVNILAAPEGIGATVAVFAWHALRLAGDRGAWSTCRAALIASGVVLAGGMAWIASSGTADVSVRDFFGALGAAFAWPWRSPLWALVLWAPATFCLIRVLGGDSRRSAMAPLAVLALALASVAAVRCREIGTAAQAVLLFGLAINAGCFALWWSTSRRSAESRLVLSAVWLFSVILGLTHGGATRVPAPLGPADRDPATLALRREVMTAVAERSGRWSDPRVQAILPRSVRAPLPLGVEEGAAWIRGVPDLVGRDDLPAVGTWSPEGAAMTGEWTSGWMSTALPLLELRVCGTLRPPDTEVFLRTSDGAEMRPWGGDVATFDRWKRLNVASPGGPFQLVVRDRSGSAWIAVTAPVEVGRLGWTVRKLGLAADALIIAAACLGCGVLVGTVNLARRSHARWVEAGAPMFPWRFVPRLALVGATAYAALNLDTTAGPNDSGGYLNSAKLLAHGQIAAEPRRIATPDGSVSAATLHVPITFRLAPDGRVAPEYPVGFPLIIAALATVVSPDAAVGATILMHLLLGVLFTRALARVAGLSEGWAWLAAAMIGLCPVYLFQGLQPMSDVPALVWVTAAVYWAWQSRERPWIAVLAGVATALAVMIRPSNLLCFAPVLVCLMGRWRQLAWWALAGLPGAAWLAWYQATLYGSPLATGYGDAASMFGLRFLGPTLESYARWLPEFFSPLVCLVVVGPFVRGAPGRLRAALAVSTALFLGVYAVYWCTWDTWYNMRFILPAAPAMVVLALLGLREVCQRVRLEPFTTAEFWRGLVPTLALVILVVAWLLTSCFSRRVLFWVHSNHEHAVVGQWARDHLPADAVVFAKHASGPLAYYTDLTLVRLDRETAQRSEFLESIAQAGRPVFAATYHWETRGFSWDAGGLGSGYPDLPGHWERLAALWEDHVFVWRWHPPVEPPRGGPGI